MAKYRLREGIHTTKDGEFLEPGAIVELSPAQAAAFGDRFDKLHADDIVVEESKPTTTIPTPTPSAKP